MGQLNSFDYYGWTQHLLKGKSQITLDNMRALFTAWRHHEERTRGLYPESSLFLLQRTLHGDVITPEICLAFFRDTLRDLRCINWSALEHSENGADSAIKRLGYLISPTIHGRWILPQFTTQLPQVKDDEILIGKLIDTEIIALRIAECKGFFGRANEPFCYDMGAAQMYWVLMWISIAWRFSTARFLLQFNRYDLEIRHGWKIVAFPPKNQFSSPIVEEVVDSFL